MSNFLASTNINGKNYLVGSNGKFINTKDHFQNLPFIFGNFETEKFLEFKNIILQTDFKYNNIKNFYYFPSGRWDIEMISGVLIKLPITGIKETLNLSIDLLEDKDRASRLSEAGYEFVMKNLTWEILLPKYND